MKIYTKKGDTGATTLIGGRSISKADDAVEVYGTVDELNANIGFVLSVMVECHNEPSSLDPQPIHHCGQNDTINRHCGIDQRSLKTIQQNLFKIGNLYAFDVASGKPFTLPFIDENDITALEAEIDVLETKLPPLKDFILPGGTPAASVCHIARTVCRRLERLLVLFVAMHSEERETTSILDQLALKYINRLSDFLFVAARTL